MGHLKKGAFDTRKALSGNRQGLWLRGLLALGDIFGVAMQRTNRPRRSISRASSGLGGVTPTGSSVRGATSGLWSEAQRVCAPRRHRPCDFEQGKPLRAQDRPLYDEDGVGGRGPATTASGAHRPGLRVPAGGHSAPRGLQTLCLSQLELRPATGTGTLGPEARDAAQHRATRPRWHHVHRDAEVERGFCTAVLVFVE